MINRIWDDLGMFQFGIVCFFWLGLIFTSNLEKELVDRPMCGSRAQDLDVPETDPWHLETYLSSFFPCETFRLYLFWRKVDQEIYCDLQGPTFGKLLPCARSLTNWTSTTRARWSLGGPEQDRPATPGGPPKFWGGKAESNGQIQEYIGNHRLKTIFRIQFFEFHVWWCLAKNRCPMAHQCWTTLALVGERSLNLMGSNTAIPPWAKGSGTLSSFLLRFSMFHCFTTRIVFFSQVQRTNSKTGPVLLRYHQDLTPATVTHLRRESWCPCEVNLLLLPARWHGSKNVLISESEMGLDRPHLTKPHKLVHSGSWLI